MPPEQGDLPAVLSKRDDGASSTAKAQVETELAEEKAERKRERFFYLTGIIVLVDCILFKFLDANLPNLFIVLVSLAIMIGLANWLEVPWVVRPLEAILAKFSKTKDGEEE